MADPATFFLKFFIVEGTLLTALSVAAGMARDRFAQVWFGFSALGIWWFASWLIEAAGGHTKAVHHVSIVAGATSVASRK
jgi:hypothetical protein